MRSASTRLSSISEPCMPRSCDSRAASSASPPCSSANCRVTRSSMLIATRSLNALCPLIMGVMSPRRKSATALASSTGVGSSCISLLPWREQPQQIDLGFRRAPADHGTLHRMVGADAKSLHHAAAHHAPAQRPHHFPEFHPLGIGAAACRRIAGKQLLARSETADRFVDLAEAPGVDAHPPQILHGIAEMRQFPVQHRAHAIGADDEIAVAEIAMHQRHLLRWPGIMICLLYTSDAADEEDSVE